MMSLTPTGRTGAANTVGLFLSLFLMLSLAQESWSDPEPILTAIRDSATTPPQGLVSEPQRGLGPEARSGRVQLETERLLTFAASAEGHLSPVAQLMGQEIRLEVFPGETYRVRISSESRPTPNSVSLIGRLPDAPFDSFSMTQDREHYIISFQNRDKRLFRITGDTQNGIGQVMEIDLSQPQEAMHLPPLIPLSD